MEIKWLRKALRNLDEEAAYIARENPAAAIAVINRVRQTVHLLADDPELGRPGRIPGTKELVIPHTRYIVPYRIASDRVEILRVFHTSRKPPTRW